VTSGIEFAALTLPKTDLQNALSGGVGDAILLQGAVFPRTAGANPGPQAIVNATGNGVQGQVMLPYTNENGSAIYLGDPGRGFPPQLYPNFTYSGGQTSYEGMPLYFDSTLLLGPLSLNDTSSLISMTIAINSKRFSIFHCILDLV